MAWFNKWMRMYRKEQAFDPDDAKCHSSRLPHLEIFTDVKNKGISAYGNPSGEKLWCIVEEERRAMFLCYLHYTNCLVVITEDIIGRISRTNSQKTKDISYEMCIYTAKSYSDWHVGQFYRPNSFHLDTSYIVYITAIQEESMIIVFGFDSNGYLNVYSYRIVCSSSFTLPSSDIDSAETPVAYKFAKSYTITEKQFSKLTTRVTSEAQEDGRLAIVFSDIIAARRPNLLFIWQIVPNIKLLKFINLRSVFLAMRGVVSGLCFWNDKQNLIIVTTTAQLFNLKLTNEEATKDYLNLKRDDIFLEKEEEKISLVKLLPRYQRSKVEVIYGIGENGSLFFIPDPKGELMASMKIFPFSGKIHCYNFSNYSKLLFIIGQNNYLYLYDLAKQKLVSTVQLLYSNEEIDGYHGVHMCTNWYGTEVYITLNGHFYVFYCPRVNTSLKEMARAVVLKNFSDEVLLNLNLPRSILYFLFNE